MGGGRTEEDARKEGRAEEPSAPVEPAPATPTRARVPGAKGGGKGSLRPGGCLFAILALLVVLTGVAIFYSPPRPPPPTAAAGAPADGGAALAAALPTIRALALSPDGTTLAYGGDETRDGRHVVRLVRIRERGFVDRQEPLRFIAAHDGLISAIRFRPDGRELFTASQDGKVGRWRLEDGEPLGTLAPPGDPGELRGLLALTISPNGRWLAAGGWSGDVFVWDLGAPAAPIVLPGQRGPWEVDPKTILPRGHVEEVRTLLFDDIDPPLLFSGGGEGLVIGWNVAERRVGRVVTVDGKTPNVRDLLMRQFETGRDGDFVIVAALAEPARGGLLLADYRGCVYFVTTRGPCRDWWLGATTPATACIRSLLDGRRICPPLDRPRGEAAAPFFGLVAYPAIPGSFVGVTPTEQFRLFRSSDTLPWREFAGSTGRGESMNGLASNPGAGFVVTGGRSGQLHLYELGGDAVSPDVRLHDHLP